MLLVYISICILLVALIKAHSCNVPPDIFPELDFPRYGQGVCFNSFPPPPGLMPAGCTAPTSVRVENHQRHLLLRPPSSTPVEWARIFTYHPVILRRPLFLDNKDASFWRQLPLVQRSARLSSEWCTLNPHPSCNKLRPGDILMGYTHGEIYGVANASLDDPLGCAQHYDDMVAMNKPHPPEEFHIDRLLVLTIHEGHSLQHFIDGVIPRALQAIAYFLDDSVDVLLELDSQKWPIVKHLLRAFGLPEERIIIREDIQTLLDHFFLSASEVITPCTCPPIHPTLWRLAAMQLGVDDHIPSEVHVAYISRSLHTYNSGRRVLNEEEILLRLGSVLPPGVKLRLFSSSDCNESDDVVQCLVNFWKPVRFVIAAHGAALYNMLFMTQGASVLEIFPYTEEDQRPFMKHVGVHVFWEMASVLGFDYWCLPVPCDVHTGDMNVDLEGFERVTRFMLDGKRK